MPPRLAVRSDTKRRPSFPRTKVLRNDIFSLNPLVPGTRPDSAEASAPDARVEARRPLEMRPRVAAAEALSRRGLGAGRCSARARSWGAAAGAARSATP